MCSILRAAAQIIKMILNDLQLFARELSAVLFKLMQELRELLLVEVLHTLAQLFHRLLTAVPVRVIVGCAR